LTVEWVEGAPLEPPVYLDASVVVAFLVRGHAFYDSAARLLAQVLGTASPIVLSDLVVVESVWGLTKLAYKEHFRAQTNQLDPTKYRRNHAAIFASQSAKVTSFASWLEALETIPHPFSHVRPNRAEFLELPTHLVEYMETFGLEGSDAANLALARAGKARTFVTADSDYRDIPTPEPGSGLTVVLIRSSAAPTAPAKPDAQPGRTKRGRRRH
jgi:predicted nucleic acid-binding protein